MGLRESKDTALGYGKESYKEIHWRNSYRACTVPFLLVLVLPVNWKVRVVENSTSSLSRWFLYKKDESNDARNGSFVSRSGNGSFIGDQGSGTTYDRYIETKIK